MSKNICQKRGSNQGKTSKKSENTNKEVIAESLESNSTHSLQWETATKKSKKRKAKSQKNDELATSATDESKIIDQEVVVDGPQNIKIGDGFCQKNENEKSPKKKDRFKKEASNNRSLKRIPETVENKLINDLQILKEDNITEEGNSKKLKKKRRLEDAKEKNELKSSCPEKIIKNVECKMTVDSRGCKEEDNDILATRESEEKPKKRRRRRNTKNKYALESSSSGKLTKDSADSIILDSCSSGKLSKYSVDSIILESSSSGNLKKYSVEPIIKSTSNHGNKQHTEDKKIPTNYNEESRSNANKTEDIRAAIKRKLSADSNPMINILRKAPSTVDVIDSKQATETENSGTVSGMSKRRKKCKNKSKNEKQSLEEKNVEEKTSINKDFQIGEMEEFEDPLLRKNESKLSNEIKEDVKHIPHNDKKTKRRRRKTSSSSSALSINTDPDCTNHNQYHTNKEIKETRPIHQSESKSDVEMDEKTNFNFALSRGEVYKQGFKISTDNIKDLCDKKEKSETKTKKLVFKVDIAPSSQCNESNSSRATKNGKIGKEQKVSKIGVTPASEPDNKNNFSQSVLEKNDENKNIGLTKAGIEKTSEIESHEFDSKGTHDDELLLKKSGNNNVQQDDIKKKKSKSKKKQNSNQQIATTDTSQVDKETGTGGKSQTVIETNTGKEEITETSSEEKTENLSTVEVKNTKKLVSEKDSESKKFISNCSKSLNALDNRELHGQENSNKNKRSKSKLKKEKKLNHNIDEEIENSNKITVPITNFIADNDQISSLVDTASIRCHNHDRSIQFNSFDKQRYDLFAISEAEKRFAKLLQSGYDEARNKFTTKSTTELDNDSSDKYYTKTTSNEYYTKTTESETDSSNDYNSITTEPDNDLSNDCCIKKYVASDDSIFDNYTHQPIIFNYFEDRVKEIPGEVRAPNPDLHRFSENFSITRKSNCNEKPYNSNCTLSWSQVAAKEAKLKSEVSQDHAPENQQKIKQKSLESSKPVRIIVADRPTRGDNDISTVDSEGFMKYVSKREMRKQRSRTSSRNDEQEVAQALEEIQNETSTNVDKSSRLTQTDTEEESICETADESNSSMEAKTVKFLFETGIWMDKWKYHDAEVEFFESKEKIRDTPLSAILQTSASDSECDVGSSASETPSPKKGKRRRLRGKRRRLRGKRRNEDKETCGKISSGEDDSTYNSDNDPINLNNDMAFTFGDSNSATEQDNTDRIENDITNDDTDSLICNSNANSSQKIKQLFVMIIMELYFMLIYYASGCKKKKVE